MLGEDKVTVVDVPLRGEVEGAGRGHHVQSNMMVKTPLRMANWTVHGAAVEAQEVCQKQAHTDACATRFMVGICMAKTKVTRTLCEPWMRRSLLRLA